MICRHAVIYPAPPTISSEVQSFGGFFPSARSRFSRRSSSLLILGAVIALVDLDSSPIWIFRNGSATPRSRLVFGQ